MALTIVDLFAGCGGAALGYLRAGFEHVALVELDPDACAALRSAFGDDLLGRAHPAVRRAHRGIVRQQNVADFSGPYADVWHSSPPCQSFSSAGARLGPLDPRNGFPALFKALARARDAGLLPRWLVIENVRGMLTHTAACTRGGSDTTLPFVDPACPRHYFDLVLRGLERYFPVIEWRVLNCADLGVPQTRQRVIVVCGPRAITWPTPTHAEGGEGGLEPWVSMRTALGLTALGGGSNPHHPGDERTVDDLTDAPSTTIATVNGNQHPVLVLDRPSTTVSAGKDRGTGANKERRAALDAELVGARPPWWHRASHPSTPSRTIGTKANASVLDDTILDAPAPTVSATEVKGAAMSAAGERTSQGGLQRASGALQLGTGMRRLTVQECLTLQSLPADWPVQGTAEAQFKQAGNCVPPPLSEAIGRALLAADSARVTNVDVPRGGMVVRSGHPNDREPR